jgi:hypothetical protein
MSRPALPEADAVSSEPSQLVMSVDIALISKLVTTPAGAVIAAAGWQSV